MLVVAIKFLSWSGVRAETAKLQESPERNETTESTPGKKTADLPVLRMVSWSGVPAALRLIKMVSKWAVTKLGGANIRYWSLCRRAPRNVLPAVVMFLVFGRVVAIPSLMAVIGSSSVFRG